MTEVQDIISSTNAFFYLSSETDQYWLQYCDKSRFSGCPSHTRTTLTRYYYCATFLTTPMARYNSLLDYPSGKIRDILYGTLKSLFGTLHYICSFRLWHVVIPGRFLKKKKIRYIRGFIGILSTSF
jgi:hypothetical protein